jgi:hypothetical protein
LALVGMGFPASVLPLVLLVVAVLVDLANTRRVPGWVAGPVVAGAVYAAAWYQGALGLLPPWNWASVRPVALLWAVVDRLAAGRRSVGWATCGEPVGTSEVVEV